MTSPEQLSKLPLSRRHYVYDGNQSGRAAYAELKDCLHRFHRATGSGAADPDWSRRASRDTKQLRRCSGSCLQDL